MVLTLTEVILSWWQQAPSPGLGEAVPVQEGIGPRETEQVVSYISANDQIPGKAPDSLSHAPFHRSKSSYPN